MDLVVRAEAIPAPGQTVLGGTLLQVRGGKGGNQAVAAARLGAEVSMIARVGDDAFGTSLCAGLLDAGINVDAVFRTPDTASGAALIVVDREGRNAICVAPGANAALSVEDVRAARALIAGADALLVQFETPLDAVVEALRVARDTGVRTFVDPAPAPTAPLSELPPGLFHADMVTPNESEASALSGIDVCDMESALAAGRALRAIGARTAVVKLGGRGCVWVGPEGEYVVPAFPVQTVDSTAAGDAFSAALAVAIGRGDDVHKALRFASAAGALKCTKMGAQPGLPTDEQVRCFLAQL